MITFWRIGKSDVLIQEKFTIDTIRDAGWAFWWLWPRAGGQEVWLHFELFKLFCLLTMKVILHETVLWILKKSTHFSLIWADADSRHGTEGNQWTDGKIRRIRRSLFSSLIRISSEHGIWVLYEFRWKGLWIQNYYLSYKILFLILIFLLIIWCVLCTIYVLLIQNVVII